MPCPRPRWPVGALVCAGLISLGAQALGFLRPFLLWRHLDFVFTGANPLTEMMGRGPQGAVSFCATVLLMTLAYGLALWACREDAGRYRTGRFLAFAFPCLFALCLLWVMPMGDLYHYVAEGRLISHYGVNPLFFPPSAFPHDPLLSRCAPWCRTPSRYGPLWVGLTYVASRLGGEDWVKNILWFKGIAVLSYLLALPLLHALGQRARGQGTRSVVFFAWNPLVLYDVLVHAHNDMPMLVLLLLALLLLLGRRLWLAWPLLMLSILVKYVTAILVPLFLFQALRGFSRRALRQTLIGLSLSALLMVLCFRPLWYGPATLAVFAGTSRWIGNSPLSLLRFLPGGFPIIVLVLRLLFAALYVRALHQMYRHEGRDDGGQPFVRSLCEVLFGYLILLSFWFWPWYVVWLLAVAAPLGPGRTGQIAVLFSLTALLGHAVFAMRGVGPAFTTLHYALWFNLVVFLPPVLLWIWTKFRDGPPGPG